MYPILDLLSVFFWNLRNLPVLVDKMGSFINSLEFLVSDFVDIELPKRWRALRMKTRAGFPVVHEFFDIRFIQLHFVLQKFIPLVQVNAVCPVQGDGPGEDFLASFSFMSVESMLRW